MQIAHIVDGNLLLEKPTRVKSFHAVLEDPSFSPMGVILLSDKLPFIPVHSLVLLYRVFSAADITFHLYLIPNHRGLEKVSVPLILFTQVWWFPGCTPRSPVHVLYAVKRDRCLQTAIPPTMAHITRQLLGGHVSPLTTKQPWPCGQKQGPTFRCLHWGTNPQRGQAVCLSSKER